MPGDFYFMKDDFYTEFADCGLLPNKNDIANKTGGRPCFFSFQDKAEPEIFWFVPISSKTEKYENIALKNIDKYGRCDFLSFGNVLGSNAVFLIQNMFPITKKYIDSRYIVGEVPVRTDNPTTLEVIKKSELVIEKQKKGIKLTFTNISKIYSTLKSQIEEVRKAASAQVPAQQESNVQQSVPATAPAPAQQENNVQKLVQSSASNPVATSSEEQKVEIVPLRRFGENQKGDVLVKLEGKSGEKTPIWLSKGSFELDRDKLHVIKVSASLQSQYNFPIPGQATFQRKH